MGLPANLRALLINRGINQVDISRELNVSQPTVSNWLKGTRSPSNKTIAKICELYNVEPNDLLSDEYGLANQVYNLPPKAKMPNQEPRKAYAPLYGKIHTGGGWLYA